MAASAPGGEARNSASVAPADAATRASQPYSRVSTVGPLPSEEPRGTTVRPSGSVASVEGSACDEPECGGAGLIGRLLDSSGACTATVALRSPLGLVEYEQLTLVRELGACRTRLAPRPRRWRECKQS